MNITKKNIFDVESIFQNMYKDCEKHLYIIYIFLQFQASMRELISRDSFCAAEIEIFRAVCNWSEHNKGQDPTPILEVVRLQVR